MNNESEQVEKWESEQRQRSFLPFRLNTYRPVGILVETSHHLLPDGTNNESEQVGKWESEQRQRSFLPFRLNTYRPVGILVEI